MGTPHLEYIYIYIYIEREREGEWVWRRMLGYCTSTKIALALNNPENLVRDSTRKLCFDWHSLFTVCQSERNIIQDLWFKKIFCTYIYISHTFPLVIPNVTIFLFFSFRIFISFCKLLLQWQNVCRSDNLTMKKKKKKKKERKWEHDIPLFMDSNIFLFCITRQFTYFPCASYV